jgi:MFS family permease
MDNDQARGMTSGERMVIFASSLGTVFEWYDFYLYGSLAAQIGKNFANGLDETSDFLFALLAFAAGFIVRPFGAIVFGRLGDMLGRKYTFLVTIVIMGAATFGVGLLPGYATLGIIAPFTLIGLRLLQGLALGGEYGGAATYVAEHAPNGRRGFYTSWIQTTATLGLFLSLIVILVCRQSMSTADFEAWGWRIPFLLSALLLAVSVWIRLKLNESPLFVKMKAEGKQSKAPLTESFARWGNLKLVIIALLGMTAGQGVVWYSGQFYARIFLSSTLKIDPISTDYLISIALVFGTPFFVIFGGLSDRIGRKPIIMLGCLLAVLTYFPIFKAITHYGNPDLEAAAASSPVLVVADPAECTLQFDPVGKAKFTSSCDLAKKALTSRGVPYANQAAPSGTVATIKVGEVEITSYDGKAPDAKENGAAFNKSVAEALKAAGYPAKADPAKIDWVMLSVMLWLLVLYVTMVYGPIAAALVEFFPTSIRYTSMSLPYHIGNGWFGGLLPFTATAIVASTGDIYSGLWYPITFAAMTFVLGMIFVHETKDVDINPTDH